MGAALIGRDRAREITMEAVVLRADGTVEDLGAVAYWNANPLKRWQHQIKSFAAGRSPGRITKGF